MPEENIPPTPEQIEAYNKARAARCEEQKKQLPLLEIERDYLTVLADIDDAILRREMARHRLANMLAPPEKDDAEKKEPDAKS